MIGFRLKIIADLYRQLRLSPPDVRRGHVDRLENLLLEFDPGRIYPYEFIYFRVTGFRPKEEVLEAHPGTDLLPDLQRALLKLAGTVPRKVSELQEPVCSVDELADALNVSARTVHRWRRRGLVACKYVFPDGRKRTGVRQAALDTFMEGNRELVARSARFRKVNRAEEREIVDLARRYAAREGPTRTAVIRRIADELGRAHETVRLALLHHDRDHPAEAIFAAKQRRLDVQDRRQIWQEYQKGAPVEELCARYGRSRSTIYRIINRQRAAELVRERIEYHHEDAFDTEEADADILGEEVRDLLGKLRVGPPPGVERTPRDAMPWQRAPLADADEAALFRAYNYSKFRVSQLCDELEPNHYVPSVLLRHIDALKGLAQQIKDCLTALHLPLVGRVARQHASGPRRLQELVTMGRGLLEQLVESFDYRSRGRFASRVTLELFKKFAQADASDEAAEPSR